MNNNLVIYKAWRRDPNENISTYYIYVNYAEENLLNEVIEWCTSNNLVRNNLDWVHKRKERWTELTVLMSKERKLEFDLVFK